MSGEWLGTVKVETRALRSVDEVRALLDPLLGNDGWVQYADGWVWRAGAARGRSPHEPTGYPLAAELVDGDASVQLRQDGAGWRWTRISESEVVAAPEVPTADERDQGYDVAFETTLEGAPRRRARYRVWWRASADPAAAPVRPLVPHVARFLGWEEV
jgi:hypothetical protein